MSGNAQTLKRFVLKIQSISAISVVLSYSLVVSYYFILGLDEANFQDLHLESNAFTLAYNNSITSSDTLTSMKGIPLPNSIHYKGYLSWDLLPEVFKTNFPETRCVDQLIMESVRTTRGISTFFYPEKALFIVAQPLADSNVLYLTREIDIEHYDALSKNGILKMIMITLPIAIVFLIIMHILVKLILKRTLKSVEELGRWADSLTIENVKEAQPSFEFIELNRIALQQQTSLIRMSEILDKEQDFLRHASHELRTPIAVVKSNSELLSRILASSTKEADKSSVKAFSAVSRINRAALNMQHTTETLLWLSRDETSILSSSSVDISALLHELIEENSYLLQGKNVNVILDLEDSVINSATTPCRLVLSNIIRNAFQYTAEGNVNISCQHDKVTIHNSNINQDELDHSDSDYGYGLGLILVDKIVCRMNWSYQNQEGINGRHVIIAFK